MNALQAQRTRRNEEIGLGAVPGSAAGHVTAPPPPTSTYWSPVPNPTAFWSLALRRPSFRSSYNASKELPTVGTTRRVLWRCWNDSGTWYATARGSLSDTPRLFQYNRPAHTGAAGSPPQGMGDLHARLAPYLDDQGILDVGSFGYDPGVGSLGSTATQNPTLQRWAALPVLPNPSDAKWTSLPASSLTVLQGQVGWAPTVASAQSHGQGMFKYKGIWYRIDSAGFSYLAGGSGRGSRPGLSGAGVGDYDPLFVPPSAAERAANPPGDALAAATETFMAYLLGTGVPSEHISDPNVTAWQIAFNADPISSLHPHGKLNVDGGYGNNSQSALAVIAGSVAPAVNTAPAPSTTPSTPTTPTTVVVDTGASTTNYTPWLVGGALVAGAGILTYAVMRHKKAQHRKYRVVAPSHRLTA